MNDMNKERAPRTLLTRTLLAAALALGAFAASRAGAQQAPAPGQSPAQVEEDLREFVPSEEIPADSAVSFPSDI